MVARTRSSEESVTCQIGVSNFCNVNDKLSSILVDLGLEDPLPDDHHLDINALLRSIISAMTSSKGNQGEKRATKFGFKPANQGFSRSPLSKALNSSDSRRRPNSAAIS